MPRRSAVLSTIDKEEIRTKIRQERVNLKGLRAKARDAERCAKKAARSVKSKLADIEKLKAKVG